MPQSALYTCVMFYLSVWFLCTKNTGSATKKEGETAKKKRKYWGERTRGRYASRAPILTNDQREKGAIVTRKSRVNDTLERVQGTLAFTIQRLPAEKIINGFLGDAGEPL